jgi:hypothetical protein
MSVHLIDLQVGEMHQEKEIQMNNMELDNIEVASPSVVHAA